MSIIFKNMRFGVAARFNVKDTCTAYSMLLLLTGATCESQPNFHPTPPACAHWSFRPCPPTSSNFSKALPQLAVILAKSLHPAPLPNFHPRRPRVFPGKSGRYAQQMHNSFHSHPGVGQNKILQDFSRHPFCRFIRSRVWCRWSSLTRHHFASKNATLQRSKSWPQAWSTNSSPNLQVQVQPQLPGMDQNISTHIRTIRILGWSDEDYRRFMKFHTCQSYQPLLSAFSSGPSSRSCSSLTTLRKDQTKAVDISKMLLEWVCVGIWWGALVCSSTKTLMWFAYLLIPNCWKISSHIHQPCPVRLRNIAGISPHRLQQVKISLTRTARGRLHRWRRAIFWLRVRLLLFLAVYDNCIYVPQLNIHFIVYIYVYVCMHACMHGCMDVCMYGCMHACMHASMYVCMYVSMYLSMYVCMYVSMYVCMYVSM